MSEVKTTGKLPDGTQRELVREYDFGETLAEKVELFGEEVVNQKAEQQMVIGLQNVIRLHLQGDKTEAEIDEAIAEWKPSIGGTRSRKSAGDKILTQFGKLSPEEQAALIASIQAAQEAAG